MSLQNTRPDQLLSQDDDTSKLTPHRRSLLFSVQFGSVLLFSTAKRRENLLNKSRSQTLGSQHGTRERKPKRRKNKASKQEQQGNEIHTSVECGMAKECSSKIVSHPLCPALAHRLIAASSSSHLPLCLSVCLSVYLLSRKEKMEGS